MTTNEDTIREAARLIWETSRADESTISATGANIVARALAESNLLRQEMTEEYMPGDGFGDVEWWAAMSTSAEEVREMNHVACCNRPIMRRWVSEWEEVPDGS